MIRAFFAIELPESARRASSDVAGELCGRPGGRDVRWVQAENLHVTLRFLGNVTPQDVAALAAAAVSETRGARPFELALGDVHGFPSSRRPRVVVVALEPEEPLVGLAEALERAVVGLGFEAEERRFRAHLTLGRLRGGRGPRLDAAPRPDCGPFPVAGFALMQSRLGPGGPTYTPLERIALEGSVHPEFTTRESREE